MQSLIAVFLITTIQLLAAPSLAIKDCQTKGGATPPACLGIQGRNEMSLKKNSLAKNVLGTKLQPCGMDPITGFYRTGSCETGPDDRGVHTVCAVLTKDFLDFTKNNGNDLSTPLPQFGFPGLKAGQRWCLCAARWLEAEKAGHAPHVVLESTHEKTLAVTPLETLKKYQIEKSSQ